MSLLVVRSIRPFFLPLFLLFAFPVACMTQDRHDASPVLETPGDEIAERDRKGEDDLLDRDDANQSIDASRRTAITRAVAKAAPAISRARALGARTRATTLGNPVDRRPKADAEPAPAAPPRCHTTD